MTMHVEHLLAMGRPGQALRELEQQFDPEDAYDWWLRGLALFDLDKLDDALSAIASGLKIEPESALLLDLLARCHSRRGDLVAAEEAALAGLRLDPEDAELLALYGLIVAKAGQLEKAKKLIAAARRADPENASALRIEAAIVSSHGDNIRALQLSRELLSINPEDSHAHAMTGELLHNRGELGTAADHLRAAVVNDPADPLFAEIARENLRWRHPLMWPLLPLHKFGAAKVWIGGIVLILLARTTRNNTVILTVAIAWIAYCVYSWIMPPIVRRLIR